LGVGVSGASSKAVGNVARLGTGEATGLRGRKAREIELCYCEQQGRDVQYMQHMEWSKELGWIAWSVFWVYKDGAAEMVSWRMGSEGCWQGRAAA
jgi:hypothetical protein